MSRIHQHHFCVATPKSFIKKPAMTMDKAVAFPNEPDAAAGQGVVGSHMSNSSVDTYQNDQSTQRRRYEQLFGNGIAPSSFGEAQFSSASTLFTGGTGAVVSNPGLATQQSPALQQALVNTASDLSKWSFKQVTSMIQGFGTNMLNSFAKPLLGKLTGGISNMISGVKGFGQGILDKIGGGILSKMGSAGQAIKSLLSGDLSLTGLAKTALMAIPGVGQVFGMLSAIPGVGPLIDKVIGGTIGFLKKIPVLGHILKGAERVLGWVGQGVGKIVSGIKTVGKTIWNGAKKVVSTVWNGAKNVVSTVWNGAKNVVSTVWNGLKSAGKAVGNFFKSIF